VRGYVVEIAERDPARLKPIAGVSGDMAVFDTRLRDALIWTAHHYLAPVAVTLERAAPPNLPTRPKAGTSSPPTAILPTDHPLDELIAAVGAGRRRPVTALLNSWGDTSWLAATAPLVGVGRSVMIVVATSAEVSMVSSRAKDAIGDDRVITVSGDISDSDLTERWSEVANRAGRILVGTPRVASWPVAGLALAVVLEEGRRAMKDRQTPTVSVRRLIMTRARLEGFSQVYVGPTPSLELLAAGADMIAAGSRAWPLVEVIDRNEEPPGSGLLTARSKVAISATLNKGGRVFVFTHRRGYAPAYRCSNCREVRRCGICGSRPEPGEACPRCGAPSAACLACGGKSFEPLGAGAGRVLAEMRAVYGDQAGEAGTDRPLTVGTERDLAALPGVDLAVAVDVDGLALGSHFRAAEDALRILARVAGRVRRGSGRRLMLQTSLPDQPLVVALRRGDPVEFLEGEMKVRQTMGYPPAAEMMVVEVRGDSDMVDADLRSGADDTVSIMGPAATHDARRWLVQGPGLGAYKLALRPFVQRWRDTGSTVRIDVDPLDL
jgi:primosomal protein N' (replication factor Y)